MFSGEIEKTPAMHVLMPAYNVENYIETAIASVLNQSHKKTVLIIYNDGSSDNTRGRIDAYLTNYPEHKNRVLITSNKENAGISHARTVLLEQSKEHNPNAYLLWLDADDQYTDLTFIETLMNQMQKTKADIGLFNYSIQYESGIAELHKFGLELDRDNSRKVLEQIYSSPEHSISPEKLPDLLNFTSFGCTKCYAPSVTLPKPANYPFEDFVYMAALLNAEKITALPPDQEPFQYSRRATSICGQRQPENFTIHIPTQLIRFFDIVEERFGFSRKRDHMQRIILAQDYVDDSLKKYGGMLNMLIKENLPGFTAETLNAFMRSREKVLIRIGRLLVSQT